MSILQEVGNAIKSALNSQTQRDNQTERALRATAIAICGGLFGVLLYAAGAKDQQIKIAIAGFLAAGAACAAGALLGLLFGIPRSLQDTPPVARAEPESEGKQPPSGSSSNTTTKAKPTHVTLALQANVLPNTNLEQISDWLTKILVGISLTRFNEIQAKFRGISQAVARSLGDAPEAFAATILLFFLICGFLKSYLWARRYLEKEFGDASRENQRIQEAREEGRKQGTDAVRLARQLNAPLANLPSQPGAQSGEDAAEGEAVTTTSKSAFAVPSPGANADDPWKGQFGGSPRANNRELSAEVTEFPGNQSLFNMVLRVRSTEPESHPLSWVRFFLHPSFPNSSPVVIPNVGGIAELRLVAWGAFTVGVIADASQTKLELDLSELPDAPKEFRER